MEKTVDRNRVAEIQSAVTAFVKSHPEWGVELTRNNASYGPDEIRLSLTLKATDEKAQQEGFRRVASLFGVKGEAYGAEVGRYGKLIGFEVRRRKCPVLIQTPSGKRLYPEAVLAKLPNELRA